MDKAAIERMQEFHKWISRHLVSLSCVYCQVDEEGNRDGDIRVAACSGFVMAFGDGWMLITAGHVIRRLDELVAHPRVHVGEFFLMDYFGSEATHHQTIPFDYVGAWREGIFESGLDYGYVLLTPNERRLLEANGIVPIRETNWMLQHQVKDFVAYLMLGIPEELVVPDEALGTGREKHTATTGTILLSVKKLDGPPPGSDETKYERFVGEIGNLGELKSLEGMSGGPIFGFAKIDGRLHYWVVALQSSWFKRKYIFGCPVPTFGRALYEMILSHLPSENEDASPQSG